VTPRTVPRSIEAWLTTVPQSTKEVAIEPHVLRYEVVPIKVHTNVHQDYREVYRRLGARNLDLLKQKTAWADREYREAYADAAVEQGVAWQVKANREARGWSQKELASLIGTKQSAISRIEDPEYGSYSLPVLQKIAHAFDCALIVKFAAYSHLALESVSLSPQKLFAKSYVDEMAEAE